jgi:dihydrofolate reductase
MAKLIYSTIASADGFVEDAGGNFGWGAPDDELMRFINELERPIGTYLYGRRMYQTMLYWETAHQMPGQSPSGQDFTHIWQGADKIVFSRTLASASASTARTRIERAFEPGKIRQLKQAASQDITVGGAGLAGQALTAGLVDELQLFLIPAIVGGGKPALPKGVRLDLKLLATRTFTSGAVYHNYRVKPAAILDA